MSESNYKISKSKSLLIIIFIIYPFIFLSAQTTSPSTGKSNINNILHSVPAKVSNQNIIKQKEYVDKEHKIDQETLDFWETTLKYGTSGQKRSVISYIENKKISIGENLILKFLEQEKNMGIRRMMISKLVNLYNTKVIPIILD